MAHLIPEGLVVVVFAFIVAEKKRRGLRKLQQGFVYTYLHQGFFVCSTLLCVICQKQESCSARTMQWTPNIDAQYTFVNLPEKLYESYCP
jgi:hypothetical protein